MAYIPVNETIVNELNNELAGSWFETVEKFVQGYNSGFLRPTDDNVKGFAEKVAGAFKDIKLSNNRLSFISPEEVYLSEILHTLRAWSGIVQLKRELNDLTLPAGTRIIIAEERGEVAQIIPGNGYDTEESAEKLDVSRVPNVTYEMLKKYGQYIENEGLILETNTINEMDDSFIEEVHTLLSVV